MNMNNNPEIKQLQVLVGSTDDGAGHHCLWVDLTGGVHIDMIPSNATPISFEESKPTMAIRFETYSCGSGYVGKTAANDIAYVTELFNDLVRLWPTRVAGKVIYADGYE